MFVSCDSYFDHYFANIGPHNNEVQLKLEVLFEKAKFRVVGFRRRLFRLVSNTVGFPFYTFSLPVPINKESRVSVLFKLSPLTLFLVLFKVSTIC